VNRRATLHRRVSGLTKSSPDCAGGGLATSIADRPAPSEYFSRCPDAGTASESKELMNPNVAIELGYAIARLTALSRRFRLAVPLAVL
jgi:hypothetical protein